MTLSIKVPFADPRSTRNVWMAAGGNKKKKNQIKSNTSNGKKNKLNFKYWQHE